MNLRPIFAAAEFVTPSTRDARSRDLAMCLAVRARDVHLDAFSHPLCGLGPSVGDVAATVAAIGAWDVPSSPRADGDAVPPTLRCVAA